LLKQLQRCDWILTWLDCLYHDKIRRRKNRTLTQEVYTSLILWNIHPVCPNNHN